MVFPDISVCRWQGLVTTYWRGIKKRSCIPYIKLVPKHLINDFLIAFSNAFASLENPRDGGVWWATVYGVAQSQTRLK